MTGSVCAGVVLVVAAAACGGEPAARRDASPSPPTASPTTPATTEPECADLTGAEAEIVMDDFVFDPRCAIVSKDQPIMLRNQGASRHNLVLPEGQLGPDVLSGEAETVTPKLKPGTYEFFCSYHPRMTGDLQVR